jgi:uncharacterized protein
MDLNVNGSPLLPCSFDPLTGFYRDGCCATGTDDLGSHTVCTVVTEEFLEFSMTRGNDLSTPRPEYRFSGLLPGDQWCLCAQRWYEAYLAGCAPKVVLASTNHKALRYVPLQALLEHQTEQENSGPN